MPAQFFFSTALGDYIRLTVIFIFDSRSCAAGWPTEALKRALFGIFANVSKDLNIPSIEAANVLLD
jgi:hypothetical protein